MINKKVIYILGFLILLSSLAAQDLLDGPESVEWDHIQDCWLVSNYYSGDIVALDEDGNQSIYTDLLTSTLGLKVKDENLYVASADGIAIFDLNTGFISSLISMPEAVLLNDLDFDSVGFLFVSDYWDNKVYRIDLSDNTYEIFVDYGAFSPNGMIFDEENDRMLACGHDGTNSIIHSFDVNTGDTELLLYPNFYSLDGFAKDSQGNIYISSWHTDTVYKFEGNNISNNVEIAASGLVDPADIFIDENDVLAVPNFSANTISLIQLELLNYADNEIFGKDKIQLANYPNPFNPSTTISFSLTTEFTDCTEISIYNLKGQKVKTFSNLENTQLSKHQITWNGTNQSNQPVSSGIYYYKLNIPNSPIKKMVLLK
ncbi:MAG: SMP-30/gluconolactonase/LRE family protein [Candidatus Cloacimonetes bacterium]|nr:SMP-30/gluconolactonase/LRE family protein [Candidatus Cloacimonadota bacterium]